MKFSAQSRPSHNRRNNCLKLEFSKVSSIVHLINLTMVVLAGSVVPSIFDFDVIVVVVVVVVVVFPFPPS